MRAIELVRPSSENGSREPAAAETAELVRYCYEHGLIVLSAGSYSNVIRLLAPLVITDGQFNEGLDVLEAGLAAAAEPRVAAAPRTA